MRSWDDVVAFVRGTRPRPPPGPKRPLATVLLVAAALAHLPLVYLLVGDSARSPALVIAIGLLSMGLAWSGGVSLEGRRQGTVRAISMLAIAEGAIVFAPLDPPLGSARWLFLVVAALAGGALWIVLSRPPVKHTGSSDP